MTETCAYCGKTFLVYGNVWGYAYGGLRTCSYRCMRKMKEEDSVTEDQKRIVDELAGQGLTARVIAEKAGVNPQNVYDYQARKRKAAGGEQPEKPAEKTKEKAPEKPRKTPEPAKEGTPERYRYGWMCPCCRMVWSPWISACDCQRKTETGGTI